MNILSPLQKNRKEALIQQLWSLLSSTPKKEGRRFRALLSKHVPLSEAALLAIKSDEEWDAIAQKYKLPLFSQF